MNPGFHSISLAYFIMLHTKHAFYNRCNRVTSCSLHHSISTHDPFQLFPRSAQTRQRCLVVHFPSCSKSLAGSCAAMTSVQGWLGRSVRSSNHFLGLAPLPPSWSLLLIESQPDSHLLNDRTVQPETMS